MTDAPRYAAPPPLSQPRPVDVLGIVAIVVAAVALLPSLAVFLIGLVPEMNAIWWLGLVLIPVLTVAGAIAIVLGVIGIVVARRRGSGFVLSIVGLALGVLCVVPIGYLFVA